MTVDPLIALRDAHRATGTSAGASVVGLGRGWGRGSGVVVGPGRVLTVAHALRSAELWVTFRDGRTETARVLAADPDLDLAVIAADTQDMPSITWEPEEQDVVAGDPVFALADPGGAGLRTTFGFVSATQRSFRGPRGRRIRGSIEHTAPLPGGASGGPLVDATGRLLGLNAVRLEGGMILALPADVRTHQRVEALARGEAPRRPRLGVALAPPRAARRLRAAVGLPERDGLLVRAVAAGSAAERAGLERGDLLVAVAGTPISRLDDLLDALEASAPDATLSLGVVRGTEDRQVTITLTTQEGS